MRAMQPRDKLEKRLSFLYKGAVSRICQIDLQEIKLQNQNILKFYLWGGLHDIN